MDTLEIAVGGGVVSGLLQDAPAARACYVFAHGAGAGMTHPFMAAVSTGLFERGVSTLRYQFPYMEKGSRRPDIPSIAHLTVRAAVAEASCLCPKPPLFAGGKSFGGRMSSQTQAQYPLPRVQGLDRIVAQDGKLDAFPSDVRSIEAPWYAAKRWNCPLPMSMWRCVVGRPSPAKKAHGTQKPVECMRRPILNNTSIS